MNRSICKSLEKSTRLCSFYMNFCKVMETWRQNENMEDFRNLDSYVEMKFPRVGILKQARDLYTIYAYEKFQEHYALAFSCNN